MSFCFANIGGENGGGGDYPRYAMGLSTPASHQILSTAYTEWGFVLQTKTDKMNQIGCFLLLITCVWCQSVEFVFILTRTLSLL